MFGVHASYLAYRRVWPAVQYDSIGAVDAGGGPGMVGANND